MATEKVKVVKLDTQPAVDATKNLKAELKKLKDTMLSTKQGTDEYNAALQRAAEITHTLKEQNEEINASAMDFGQIISNCTKVIGGMVAGFQAAQAAMNLLGIENDEVIKSMQKMQSLMALTQALPAIENARKAFGRLVTNIQAATKATSAWGKALIATGLGAIVVALGYIVTHFDEISKWLDKITGQTDFIGTVINNIMAGWDAAKTAFIGGFKLIGKAIVKYVTAPFRSVMNAIEAYMGTDGTFVQKIKAAGTAMKDTFKDDFDEIKDDAQQLGKDVVDSYNKGFESRQIKKLSKEIMKGMDDYEKELDAAANHEKSNLSTRVKNYEQFQKEIARIDYDRDKKLLAYQKKLLKDNETGAQKLTYNAVRELESTIWQLENKVKAYEANLAKEKAAAVAAAKNAQDKADKEHKIEVDKLKGEYDKLSEYLSKVGISNFEKQTKELADNTQKQIAILKNAKEEGIITEKEYNDQSEALAQDTADKLVSIYVGHFRELGSTLEDYISESAESYRNSVMEANQEMLANGDITFREYMKNVESTSSVVQYYAAGMAVVRNALVTYQEESIKRLAELDKAYEDGAITLEEYETVKAAVYEEGAKLEAEYAKTTHEYMVARAEDINYEMDVLRDYSDEIANAMDSIISTADGLSSHWTDAFSTMSQGLIDLGQSLSDGSAGWSDYAKMAVAALQTAGSIMSALADEQEADTVDGFEQQKKYQIAAATMNMLGGITAAWVSAMNPANAWMNIWGQIAMGAAASAMVLATGIMQIQKIQQQQFNGGGPTSSSPSAGAIGSVIAPVQYTQDVQGASIEDAIQDTRVYVTETDISNTQRRVSVTENEARY